MNKAMVLWLALFAARLIGEDKLAGGPYVVNVDQRSATIAWVVETGQTFIGTTPGKAEKTSPVLRAEKVSFTGLEPGKTYYYNALGRNEGKGSFKTSPTGPAAFQFVVYGDTRTRRDMHRKVIGEIARESFWTEQTRWLEEDLRKSQPGDFRFVIAHHPPLTAVARRQGDNPQMTALMPIFEKYKLTAGFFGHDHNYQHYLKDGVHYFITGGGGAPLYERSTLLW